jgi:hypothetical protein
MDHGMPWCVGCLTEVARACGALALQEELQKDKAAQKREERLLVTAVYEVCTALTSLVGDHPE